MTRLQRKKIPDKDVIQRYLVDAGVPLEAAEKIAAAKAAYLAGCTLSVLGESIAMIHVRKYRKQVKRAKAQMLGADYILVLPD